MCQALSDLADATLQAALSVAAGELPAARRRSGSASSPWARCGARELNYVSDVDVIFIADGDDTCAGTATQLASRMMRICGSAAWEVDAGLRPEGKAGALVRTPASHAGYYQRWAHTWEFQAMLKARPAAGDLELGGVFMDITRPGCGPRPAGTRSSTTCRPCAAGSSTTSRTAYRDRELKLGAGGLRDVEFAVQLLQLVHGRTDPDLRLPGTLMALRSLIRGGYVGRTDGAEMAAAYTFLRRTEHRLQLQRLRRTHLLPGQRRRPGVAGPGRRLHGLRHRRTRPRCSSRNGCGTPPRSADCTRSSSTGRCCTRSRRSTRRRDSD